MPEQGNRNAIWFVYDGECPICRLGARIYRLRQAVGDLHTIDARTHPTHPLLQEIKEAQLNLDRGMVIKYQDQLYQGAEALHLMAKLGSDEGMLNRLNNRLFKSRFLSIICYPFMRLGRNIALMLKGAGKIRNLEKP